MPKTQPHHISAPQTRAAAQPHALCQETFRKLGDELQNAHQMARSIDRLLAEDPILVKAMAECHKTQFQTLDLLCQLLDGIARYCDALGQSPFNSLDQNATFEQAIANMPLGAQRARLSLSPMTKLPAPESEDDFWL